MTREENLHWIDEEIRTWENECQSKHPIKEALYAARKSLEQEPKTAHWIKEESIYGWDGHSYQCSECGRSIHLDTEMEDLEDYPYCHCGAKMQEGESMTREAIEALECMKKIKTLLAMDNEQHTRSIKLSELKEVCGL